MSEVKKVPNLEVLKEHREFREFILALLAIARGLNELGKNGNAIITEKDAAAILNAFEIGSLSDAAELSGFTQATLCTKMRKFGLIERWINPRVYDGFEPGSIHGGWRILREVGKVPGSAVFEIECVGCGRTSKATRKEFTQGKLNGCQQCTARLLKKLPPLDRRSVDQPTLF